MFQNHIQVIRGLKPELIQNKNSSFREYFWLKIPLIVDKNCPNVDISFKGFHSEISLDQINRRI